MKPMLYIIGASGSGKTTTMAAVLDGIAGADMDTPIAHTLYDSGAVQLGRRRGTFSGTDALPLGVQPKALRFLAETTATAILAEGDRLANAAFFTQAIRSGFDLRIILLDVDRDTSASRRAERGHTMTAAFVKGRETKATNLAAAWQERTTIIDARNTVEAIAAQLAEHPAIVTARGKR